MKPYLFIVPLILMAFSCTSHKYVYSPDNGKSDTKSETTTPPTPLQGVKYPETSFIPKATAFRMNGDFSDNVAITLAPDGIITYFPAPSDITADSKPVSLGNGWWLNNQGFGPNSVFTTYTFAEYAALPQTPSPEQLMNAIIPNAKVTEMMELPFNINQVNNNIEKVKDYLKDR